MPSSNPHPNKRLKFEPLEDRRLLAVFTVSNLSDGPVTAAGDLPGSLRQAIFDANALPGDDEIEFSVTGDILLNSGQLEITDGLTINGPGQELLTVDARNGLDGLFATGDGHRIFNLDDGNQNTLIDITIAGLTVKGGDVETEPNGSTGSADLNGGGIRSYENLTILQSSVINNAAGHARDYSASIIGTPGGWGGGIWSNHGTLVINSSTISHNRAGDGESGRSAGRGGSGGGISATLGDLIISNSVVQNNYAGEGGTSGQGFLASRGSGGAVFKQSGEFTVTDSIVTGNFARKGGGIYSSAALLVSHSVVYGNSTEGAHADGGGIYGRGSIEVLSSLFHANQSGSSGGAISSAGPLTISASDIRGNIAGISGGGLHSPDTIELHDVSVESNTSGNFGGGIRAGQLISRQSSISGNQITAPIAGRGGGIFANYATLMNSTISGNTVTARKGGGGAFAGGEIELFSSTVVGNKVMPLDERDTELHWGGIISNRLIMESSIVANNTALGVPSDIETLDAVINHSLIGDTTGSGIDANTGTGNLLNIDPLLGPLADNGGPTQTHALLPGSPAIDAGDIGILDPPMYDQRGALFNRIVDGNVPADVVIDIGAYEAQGVPSADFNTDNALDGFDFLTWQRGLGKSNAVIADGDSDFDADVDASDLAAWQITYGQGTSSSVQAATAETSPPDPALAIAAALADEAFEDGRLLSLPQTSTVAPPDVLDPIRSSAHPSSAAADSVAKEEKAIRTSATRDGGVADPFAGPWDGLRRKFLK